MACQKSRGRKRQYTNAFQLEAARLSETVGPHKAARRLGAPVATFGNWRRRSRSSEDGRGASGRDVSAKRMTSPISELEAENSRLPREPASAKRDIEILSKAAAYFAKGAR